MKTEKALKIIEIALVFLTVLFVILKNVWSGFNVMALVMLVFVLLGAITLAFLGYKNTKKELKEEFCEYLAIKYREGKITKEQFETQDQTYFKSFMKENWWELARYFAMIVICAAVLVTIILTIF